MLGVFLLHCDCIHTPCYDQKMWSDVGLVWDTPILLFTLQNEGNFLCEDVMFVFDIGTKWPQTASRSGVTLSS